MTFTTLHSATPTPTGIAQQPTVDPVLQQQHLQQLQQLQQQELLPADVVSTIIGLAERHGPAILERIFRLFQSQPHLMQAGLQPYGVSQPIVPWAQQPMPYGMAGMQQNLLPADAVSAIIGLGAVYGPAIVKRIFDLFQSQPHLMQAGLQPYGVSQPIVPWAQQPMPYGMQPYGVPGMGQDLLPAGVLGTVLRLIGQYGPAILERVSRLIQSQPHLMQAGLQPYGVSQPIVPWAQQPMPYGMQPYGVPGMGQDLLPADVVSTIIGLGVRHGPAIIKRIFDLFQSQFPAQPMFQPQFPTQPMSVPQPVGAFV